jgi:hypothetical protein
MGKRTSGEYERDPRDYHPTPYKATLPLKPHLLRIRTFAEPCCGDGRLVRHLESFGLICVYAGDISTGRDALDLTAADLNGADTCLTNPPFSKTMQPLLRRQMTHFMDIAPSTWLLLPHDFAQNKWFAPFHLHCTDIQPIGRVKWIEGTEHSGFENASWYRLQGDHAAGPIVHPRGLPPATGLHAFICAECGKAYRPKRNDSRVCGDTCRQRAHRARLSVTKRDIAGSPGGAP